jgi:hypothetical protein
VDPDRGSQAAAAAAAEAAGGGPVVEAEIQVGGVSVRYLRAGRGTSMLLLLGDPVDEPLAGNAFASLARHHRVFRPLGPIPRGRDEVEHWLRGLVEGLGLRSPDVVADARLAPLLARLVRRNGGFVGQVVFLAPREEGGERGGGL